MKFLIFAVFIAIFSSQNVVNSQQIGNLLDFGINLELATFDGLDTFLFNIFQRYFQLNILDIIKHVNLTSLLDGIDDTLQRNLDELALRLPSQYKQYKYWATDAATVVKAITSDFKPVLAVVASVYLQVITILIDKFGISDVDKVFALSNVPLYKEYLQGLFALLNKALTDAGASDFVQSSLLDLGTVNKKYDGQYSNIPATIQCLVYIKILLAYQSITASGVEVTLSQIQQLNLGNFLSNTLINIDGLLADLAALNASSLVQVGKYIRTELTRDEYDGLPQTLIGGVLNIILSAVKSLLENISSSELTQVVQATNTLDSISAITNLEAVLNQYEISIKIFGNDEAILGVIILAHEFTRFMNPPFKIALKSCVLILAVAIDAALKFVNEATIAQLLGTAQINYGLLIITNVVSLVIGLPTGS